MASTSVYPKGPESHSKDLSAYVEPHELMVLTYCRAGSDQANFGRAGLRKVKINEVARKTESRYKCYQRSSHPFSALSYSFRDNAILDKPTDPLARPELLVGKHAPCIRFVDYSLCWIHTRLLSILEETMKPAGVDVEVQLHPTITGLLNGTACENAGTSLLALGCDACRIPS